MLRELNPFPHTVISSAERNLPYTLLFLVPFTEGFPFSAITHTALYQCARKIPPLRSGWQYRNSVSKHIRCTLPEINPFPHTVIRGAARNLPCTPSFLAPFAERFSHFPLSHIGRYTSMPERSLHFGRDDDTGIALSKHIRCTLREINPSPPYCHFERSEKSSLYSALFCSFRKRFPFFHYHTYSAIPVCKKDPSTSLGMTIQE